MSATTNMPTQSDGGGSEPRKSIGTTSEPSRQRIGESARDLTTQAGATTHAGTTAPTSCPRSAEPFRQAQGPEPLGPELVAEGLVEGLRPAETAQARSFLWRFLAAAFTLPDETTWRWLSDGQTCRLLERAQAEISQKLRKPLQLLILHLHAPRMVAEAQDAFLKTFGHTVRGDCPPHEIEYGELKADALFQPHRLADIAAFYSAFGLELTEDADDRLDHIAMECEFFSVLCAKEAAAAAQGDQEHAEIVRQAQKQFLREHLGRWTPAFSRRLARHTHDKFLQSIAEFLRACVLVECERIGIPAGNDDLMLRPAEEMMDPCGQCGIAGLHTAEAVK